MWWILCRFPKTITSGFFFAGFNSDPDRKRSTSFIKHVEPFGLNGASFGNEICISFHSFGLVGLVDNGCSRCSILLYRVFQRIFFQTPIRLYRVLLGFTGFDWVLPGFTGFYWVILGFTEFLLVFVGFTGFYWVLLGFIGFDWVWLGLTGFYRVLPSFIGFYWVLPGSTGFLSSFT